MVLALAMSCAGFVSPMAPSRAVAAMSRGPATFSMQVKGLGGNSDQRPIEMIHADADAAFKMLDEDNGGSIDNDLLNIDLELVNVTQIRTKRQPTTPALNNSSPPSAEVDSQDDLSLEDYFQRFVLEHQDSMSETELARKLGVSRKCLWERRQRLGIPRKKGPKSVNS